LRKKFKLMNNLFLTSLRLKRLLILLDFSMIFSEG